MEVNHKFSFTFQPGRNQWSKVELELVGLDTNLPIEEQLESMDDIIKITWPYLKAKVDEEVAEIFEMANNSVEE